MALITPLWRSTEISSYRFNHPVEHEDRTYEVHADCFRASFVEEGRFNLEIGERGWRVAAGDVMLSHPGMRFRASFDGEGFNDICLSVIYLSAGDERFDPSRTWARAARPVWRASNRIRYLRWLLRRAIELDAPMLAEYGANEIFREHDESPAALYREHKASRDAAVQLRSDHAACHRGHVRNCLGCRGRTFDGRSEGGGCAP